MPINSNFHNFGPINNGPTITPNPTGEPTPEVSVAPKTIAKDEGGATTTYAARAKRKSTYTVSPTGTNVTSSEVSPTKVAPTDVAPTDVEVSPSDYDMPWVDAQKKYEAAHKEWEEACKKIDEEWEQNKDQLHANHANAQYAVMYYVHGQQSNQSESDAETILRLRDSGDKQFEALLKALGDAADADQKPPYPPEPKLSDFY